ncbi:HAD hydrolase-like protein [Candidatus Woesearchaeota archaeon]|nr:HAD hydrolase-like protein [Candidatus Woesearchaeota archaeon]
MNFIFFQDDAGCWKNNIVFWKKSIQQYHLIPKLCVVIGDNPIEDGQIPRKAGFKTVLVSGPKDLLTIAL